jgi:serine/threonine-protein kinase
MIVPNADVPGGEQIKILDFGIAKINEGEGGNSEAHTRADALLGTPRYMSPEQCKGSGGVDAKSDVYSLGVIFFELLAGRPPFAGSAHGELIVQHMMQEPPALAPLVDPGTADLLIQLVHRMLTKDKNLRPTMRQVVGELDRLGGYMSGVYGVLPQVSSGGIQAVGYGMPTPPPGGLSHPSLTPVTPSMPGYPPNTGTIPSHNGMTPIPGGLQAGPGATLGSAAGQVPVAPPRKFPLSVAIGGGLGAVAVAVVLLVSLNKAPPPIIVTPLPPRPVVVQRPPEPAKKLVHWAVGTTPDGAMVIRQRDGQVLGVTPLVLTNPAGTGTEQLRIVLQGYAEQPLTLDRSQDSEQQFDLRRKGASSKRVPGTNPKKNTKGYVPSDLTVVD